MTDRPEWERDAGAWEREVRRYLGLCNLEKAARKLATAGADGDAGAFKEACQEIINALVGLDEKTRAVFELKENHANTTP